MYEQFFKFSQRPFASTPSSSCFVATSAIEDRLHEVGQCLIDGRGIALLTASAGMGKTLFCQQLIKELQPKFQTAFLANAQFPTRRSFLQTFLYELGHGYIRQGEEEVRIILKRLLKSFAPPRSSALLVIDEADHLSQRMLDEIRGLSNLIEDEMPLVRIVLCGPHALEENLLRPENNACYQRVACQVTLEHLTIQESVNYIQYRLQHVGSSLENTFQHDATEAICQASDGSPRALNQLCDHSLMLGYLAEQTTVDLPTVLEALDDLKHLPLCWNEPSAAKATYENSYDMEQAEIKEDHLSEVEAVEEKYVMTGSEITETTHSASEQASFEVGRLEVGAEIETDQPMKVTPAINLSETEPTSDVPAAKFETENVENDDCAEIEAEEQSVTLEEEECETRCIEIGAEVLVVEESTIPLAQETVEPDLLEIEADLPDASTKADESQENKTEQIDIEEHHSHSEEPTIEIVFDRYALIDSVDPASSNCINLTETLAASLDQAVSVNHTTDNETTETETVPVEIAEESVPPKNEIRNTLIQVCQETREEIGHQLNLLEEIWETSDINHEIAIAESNEPKATSDVTSTIPALDLFSIEVKEDQADEEAPPTSIDLTAMRQRLSQRFKQLRRKQG